MSPILWARPASAARTISPGPSDGRIPARTGQAAASQCGAASPAKAGTRRGSSGPSAIDAAVRERAQCAAGGGRSSARRHRGHAGRVHRTFRRSLLMTQRVARREGAGEFRSRGRGPLEPATARRRPCPGGRSRTLRVLRDRRRPRPPAGPPRAPSPRSRACRPRDPPIARCSGAPTGGNSPESRTAREAPGPSTLVSDRRAGFSARGSDRTPVGFLARAAPERTRRPVPRRSSRASRRGQGHDPRGRGARDGRRRSAGSAGGRSSARASSSLSPIGARGARPADRARTRPVRPAGPMSAPTG
jgi:hypothetical protein